MVAAWVELLLIATNMLLLSQTSFGWNSSTWDHSCTKCHIMFQAPRDGKLIVKPHCQNYSPPAFNISCYGLCFCGKASPWFSCTDEDVEVCYNCVEICIAFYPDLPSATKLRECEELCVSMAFCHQLIHGCFDYNIKINNASDGTITEQIHGNETYPNHTKTTVTSTVKYADPIVGTATDSPQGEVQNNDEDIDDLIKFAPLSLYFIGWILLILTITYSCGGRRKRKAKRKSKRGHENQVAMVEESTPDPKTKVLPDISTTPYNHVILDETSEYIRHVATRVGTRNVTEFFSLHLQLPVSKYEPHRLVWLENPEQRAYSEYILKVLKEWLRLNGRNATLAWLIGALVKADIEHVALDLTKMFQERRQHEPENTGI